MSVRSQQVGNEIRKALSSTMDAFTRDHGGGMLTITNVVMSPDLSIAKVYLSVFASPHSHEQIVKDLSIEAYRFKKAIVSKLRLRIVPELRFYIDSSLDEVDRISKILKENPPFHRESSDEDGVDDSAEDGDELSSHESSNDDADVDENDS